MNLLCIAQYLTGVTAIAISPVNGKYEHHAQKNQLHGERFYKGKKPESAGDLMTFLLILTAVPFKKVKIVENNILSIFHGQ